MVKQPQTSGWGVGCAMTSSDSDLIPEKKRRLFPVRGWAGYCKASSSFQSLSAEESLQDLLTESPSWLPVGNGCSYGDAALNEGGTRIQPASSDPLRSDVKNGTVWVSAAMPLSELLPHLSIRGWTLPVVPGVLSATVGGMVASDVHGKNHLHRGSFGNSVEAIELILTDGQKLKCSREVEPEIFRATLGGMGLTGLVTAVLLRLVRRSASVAEVTVTTTEDLDQTLQTLEKVAVESDHSSAWVDFSLRSRSTGRGVITGGNLIPVSGDPEACQLWEPSSGPELPPLPTPGENLIHWHNRLYHLLARRASRSSFWPLEKLLFPLEAWSSWQKVYEPAGFHQHQSLIPEKAGLSAVKSLFQLVSDGGISPTLVVIKRMGEGRGGLSFPAPGWTVSMDFAHGSEVLTLLGRLNQFTAEAGGRVYLSKDSTLSAELMREMYPDLGSFMEVRNRVDPQRKIRSCLADRLDL